MNKIYFDTKTETFAIPGLHGGRMEKKYIVINTPLGQLKDDDGELVFDDDGKPVMRISTRKFYQGLLPAGIPKHWLTFDKTDPLFKGTKDQELKYLDGKLQLVDKPPMSEEQKARRVRKAVKAKRNNDIRGIVVTVDDMQFDGDERSRGLMVEALSLAMGDVTRTTQWKLYTNDWVEVTFAQLAQAADLSAKEQIRIMKEADT